jgi:hypothetical protein
MISKRVQNPKRQVKSRQERHRENQKEKSGLKAQESMK